MEQLQKSKKQKSVSDVEMEREKQNNNQIVLSTVCPFDLKYKFQLTPSSHKVRKRKVEFELIT